MFVVGQDRTLYIPGGSAYKSGTKLPEQVIAYMRSGGSLPELLASGAIVDLSRKEKPTTKKPEQELGLGEEK